MSQDLLQGFLHSLQQEPLRRLRGRILVAVSGGADSVALLHLLHRAARHIDLQLTVAHLDHGLRAESGADAAFVTELAAGLGLPVCGERIDVAARLAPGRGGPEEIAREVRREFLERSARQSACPWIALGHHRDDQAETFLLRLLRGAGTSGLAAMEYFTPPYVRPLLGVSRAELLDDLTRQGLNWREDPSNQSLEFTRNRLRHQLLPLLQEYNPQIVEQLTGLSQRFAEEEIFWRQWAEAELLNCVETHEEGGLLLPVVALLRQPAAVGARLVRGVLHQVRGDLRRISTRHLAMIRTLAESRRPQGEICLPGAWVGRRYGCLWFRAIPPEPFFWSPVRIDEPGRWPLPDGRWLLVEVLEQTRGECDNAVEFDAAEVRLPLWIRTAAPGDRLQPKGMDGTRKLQDLFVDRKLTREQRRRQPLIVQAGCLLWVVGLQRCGGSEPAKRAGGKVLRLSVAPP